MTATSSLSITLTQAIAYLTRPLTVTHPVATINKLQSVLEANLIALFAPTWTPKEPLRGSGQRCLTLSPNRLPPRAIYTACLASSVHWFDWIAALGGREFDFYVDPGCISVQFGRGTKLITIWAEEPIAKAVYCSSDLCSCFSATTASTLSSKKSNKQSSQLTRREKAKQARVFVDTSKTEVTPYDGGKTTVLTGGVMLGAAPPKGKSGPSTWRRT
ncbi:uncharacterized protein BJ212DRAFT_1298486 [Suillus subaureus]|uniref:Anti-proliferative protein domain-containing protein n=1 Tax=Suillus subaureus TaxID=48587 RepID=A0A9P7EED4_9AGAM|nr:uncharacterized protein BJ212DRAFT_1298486 [Suillus subaureus]KAG1819248.1 hypothetical protein BJ212DRAFT_1298486 [Suillus subaureus]